MNKKIILMVLTIFFMMCITTGCGKKEVDISQYIKVNYSGINGMAKAEVKFDFPDFEKQMWEYEKQTQEAIQWITDFEASLECNVNNSENLSNGDEITVTLSFDSEIPKKHKYNFIGKEKIIEVSNLSEGTKVDLFEHVNIKYSDVAPFAKATVENVLPEEQDNSYLRNISFVLDKDSEISNGDTITVKANCDMNQALENGIIIDEADVERQYVVEGIDAFVDSFEIMDENTLKKIEQSVNDSIQTRTESALLYKTLAYPEQTAYSDLNVEEVEIKEIELLKSYFLYISEDRKNHFYNLGLKPQEVNVLYNIYKISTTDNRNPDGVEVFGVVKYSDFILKGNGEIEIDLEKTYVYTYTSLDEIYQENIEDSKKYYVITEITE